MELGLKGKVAVVTASSRGLGRAAAEALAGEGMHCVLCSRTENDIVKTADWIRKTYGVETYAEACDVSSAGEMNRFARNVLERFGTVHVLFTNAGGPPSGMVRDFSPGDYENALIAATKIKKSETANEELKREASYTEGKSYYMTGKPDKAIDGLKVAAADVKYEQGAEAKYLLAEIYFKQKNIQKSETEILDFIDKNTPHQYWLGKSFILLADIYLSRNDEFQAKHTLKSLVENYNVEDDGIIAEASKKLSVIENKEKTDQQNAIDNSYQMKIKEQ